MKISNSFSLFFLLLFFSKLSVSQSFKQFTPININQLPNDAFEEGKLSFKIHQFSEILKNKSANIASFISTNKTLKQLFNLVEAKDCKQIFAVSLLNQEFEFKHNQFGLNRWFTLSFNKKIPIKSVIDLFQKTNLFEVVEPVYKKELLGTTGQNKTEFSTNDARFNEQWSFENNGQSGGSLGKDIKLKQAWDFETGNPNVQVAIIDQGIQLNHPDLAQNIAIGKSYNFVDNSTTIDPGHHGTHIGGTIAAVSNNSLGVSGIAGGNGNPSSGIRLMSMQVYNNTSAGGHADALIYAADNGACIANNSWAYVQPNVYELSIIDAIDYFIENGGGSALQGGLVIFAAGNNSRPAKFYPSAYERVICVAASNNKDEKANYSTFGQWVDITAPGGEFGGTTTRILSTTINSEYSFDHGTSMSCPHVAGVAALVVSKLNGRASANDVREILLSTTDDIYTINPALVGQLGTGRLNAFKALQKAQLLLNNYGVPPVSNISGNIGCNTINLNWIKNTNNNDVIILYSNNADLPLLVNGTVYNVGDKVNDATVIYKGSGTNLTIANNQKFLHFFKIFSLSNSNQFSLSRVFEKINLSYVDSSGNLSQNFDFPPYFPTQEWRVINPDNDISWMHTAADTNFTGFKDDYSMCMYNYEDNLFEGRVDWLRSPLFNIINADSIHLSFNHAYKYRNTGLLTSDSLEVLISTDCGTSWNTLMRKGGKQLATITSETDSFFRPFGDDKWQLNYYDLTPFKWAEKIQLSFEAVNGKGNNLYVDNINLSIRYKNDICPISVEKPFTIGCNNSIIPQVKIKNKGSNVISSFRVTTYIDGATPITTSYNGNLLKDGIAFMALNSINNISTGKHKLKIITSIPNNLNDGFALNDTLVEDFVIENASTTFPLVQNFESNTFNDNNWRIEQNPNDSLTWVTTNTVFSNGSKSAMINNYFYDYTNNRKDDILSPIVTIDKEIDSAFLSYSYAHATKHNPLDNKSFDTLEISVSKDCGITWQLLSKKWGNSLQTTNQTTGLTTYFTPSFLDWKRDSLNITGFFNKNDKVRFRFRNTQNFGNNLYLDDIKIYTKTLPLLLKQNGYLVYPNPTNGKLNIDFLQLPATIKNLRIINSVGKVIKVEKLTEPRLFYSLQLLNLASGVYTLQLLFEDKVITQKFVKI